MTLPRPDLEDPATWEKACLDEVKTVFADLLRQSFPRFEGVGEPRLVGSPPHTQIITPVKLRDGRPHDLDFPLWDELASGPINGRATPHFVATLVMTDVIEAI